MKASSLLHPIPCSRHSLFHKLHRISTTSLIKPVSLASIKPISNHIPKTPLFLKPPIYSTPTSELTTFTTWAKNLISSTGSTFLDLDNGPDSSLLQRELKWFLDDVVQEPYNSAGEVVKLRENLETMYELWEERMVKRRPFQYIVGSEHWRDLVLSVEEGVLIPRPETGEIVDFVDGLVKDGGGGGGGVWADLGTGSCALAIGIARVLGQGFRVVATDVSHVAVSVAKYNVQRYGLQDVIEVRQGSWFDPIKEFEGQLAGLVSNPPYIPSEDIGGLQVEVGKHEPWLALDGGVDGLDYLSYLCRKTSTMLKPGGFFAFETNGEKQCKILAEYLKNESRGSICNVNIVSDFAGVPRFVTGHRK